ncbi:S-layer homology domain-containing protein [Paenibacillus dokdonensis]|uniref:S-layer homology domain-containing protein n=1 Tax=Paenibacillus dokdonensis TaxID=2567944 RepID=A0ABU6GN65_9BACL|nr:YcdB/YcdC domain-containing protein [Paenibacillus dokdonensis]MEC0239696.1 S-layer homology domain-containing protein [Paenibacillus dokdonensis]
MKRGKMSTRQAQKRISTKTVAKTVLASTIGLSLLQIPVWAAASTASGTGFAVVKESNVVTNTQTSGENAKIRKEEAEQKMITLFPSLKDAKLENSSYSETENMPGHQSVWMFNWTITKGNTAYGMSTGVDAETGDVLSYYQPYNLNGEESAYYPAEITKEKAEKLARDFIAQAAPSLQAGELITSNGLGYNASKTLFGPVTYNFNYNIKINGIPSDGEYINIGIDGKGRIFSYNRSATDIEKYPSPKPSISQPKAVNAFKQDLSLTLAYVPFNDFYASANSKKDWQLAYIPAPYLTAMDALTGKRLNAITRSETTVPKELEYTALPASSNSFKAHQGKTLTSKEAQQLFADFAPSGKDYTLSTNLSNYWMDASKQVWNLNWDNRSMMGMGNDSIHMMVDADTGQLINYNVAIYSMGMNNGDDSKSSKEAQSSTAVISESKAREKAIDLVSRYYPEAAKVLKLSNESSTDKTDGKTSYRFVFQRFYKDLPVYNQQVTVAMDGSGKLLSYSMGSLLSDGFEKDLDSLTAKVTLEDALRTYKESLGAELRYTADGGYYTETKYLVPTISLSYVPTFDGERSLPFLNAVTGKSELYGYSTTKDKGDPANLPSDVVSHSASKDLAILLDYNVITPGSDGLLHPDAELSYGDMMNMFSKAVMPDQNYYDAGRLGTQYKDVAAESPYAQATLLFTDRGWLRNTKSSELHPEQKLTREKMADMIIDILHYDQLSKYYNADPKVMSLSDAASIQNKGAVELVLKLGLMTSKDDKFDPAKTVTKAEAAQILVLLAHIQGKVDTPISY